MADNMNICNRLAHECNINNVTHDEGDDCNTGVSIMKVADFGPITKVVEEDIVDNKHQFNNNNFVASIIGYVNKGLAESVRELSPPEFIMAYDDGEDIAKPSDTQSKPKERDLSTKF